MIERQYDLPSSHDKVRIPGFGTLTKRGERVLVWGFLLLLLACMAIVGKVEGL